MGMVDEACLPSNVYYPRTSDYTLYLEVHVCWSEHSDLSFIYGFMSLNYGLSTMTSTTCRLQRRPLWQPSWIWEQNNFSNSESLWCYDASHQVLIQSDLQFQRRCHLKHFKTVVMRPSWILEQNKIQLNMTYGLGDVIWRISRWPPWGPSWILERNDFSNSESLCHVCTYLVRDKT